MKTRRIVVVLAALAMVLGLGWGLRKVVRHLRGPALVIRLLHTGTSEDSVFWQGVIQDFQKAHRRIYVKQEFVSREVLLTQLREPGTDKSPPQVVLMPHMAFPEFSDGFEVLGRSNSLKDDGAGRVNFREYASVAQTLDPTGLRAFESNYEQRALPVCGGSLMIFLNLQSFKKASEFHVKPVMLPTDDWTIAEFLRTAEQLTCDFDRDGSTDQFGFALPAWPEFLPFLWTFGANLTDESGTRWTLLGSPAESAMRFYRRLAAGDRVSPRWYEMPGLSQDTGFLTGKIAMRVDGPWFIRAVEDSMLTKNYAIAPIPRGPGGPATSIVWNGIAVRKRLPERERTASWSFIQFALSKEMQERFAKGSLAIPARRDVQDVFAASDPPRRRAFITWLPHARILSALPSYESLDRALSQQFDEVADPTHPFDAPSMLEALARNPAIIGAFSKDAHPSP